MLHNDRSFNGEHHGIRNLHSPDDLDKPRTDQKTQAYTTENIIMWILVLSLLSNPNGQYTQAFDTEKECVYAMNTFIRHNDTNPDVKYIGCAKSDLALNDDE